MFFEVKKHEILVSHYEAAMTNGETEFTPRLSELRESLDIHRSELLAIKANPELASLTGRGQIDVSRHKMTTLPPGGTGTPSSRAPLNELTDPVLLSKYPSARYVASDKPLLIDGLTINNLGVDLGTDKSFRKSGGEVFLDDQSGTVILSINMVTNRNENELTRIEVPYKKINGDWRADFTRYNELSVSDSIRLSDGLALDRTKHFLDANKKLVTRIEANPELKETLGLDDTDVAVLKKSSASPESYTWHHVNAEGDMMLVDRYIHGMFTHTGGFSQMQSNFER